MQLIRKKDCKDKAAEVAEENKAMIITEYFNRSLYTLQGLTKLLKVEFHYERLFKKYETQYDVDAVLMLMLMLMMMMMMVMLLMMMMMMSMIFSLCSQRRGRSSEATGSVLALELQLSDHSPGSIQSEGSLKDRMTEGL